MTAPRPILTKENAHLLIPQFKRVSELEVGEGETFLIYGGTGTGKTELCGTAGARALFINAGGGIKTLQSPGFRKRNPEANPITVEVIEKVNAHGIFEKAEAYDVICDIIDYALDSVGNDFDWVIIDDATAFSKFAMNKGLESNEANRKSQTLKEIRRTNTMQSSIQDYQAEMNLIEQFLFGTVKNQLVPAGKNFVMTAHLRETFVKGDKIGELPKLHSVRPGFTGQTFPDEVPGFFDNVFLSQCVSGGSNPVYRVTTSGDEVRYAKTRHSGVFETVETNPNLSKFIERIRKNQEFQKGKK